MSHAVANTLVLHRDRVDGQRVKGALCPIVASRRSTVGSMPIFRPTKVGSNPEEGRVASNIPKPPLYLFGGGSWPLGGG